MRRNKRLPSPRHRLHIGIAKRAMEPGRARLSIDDPFINRGIEESMKITFTARSPAEPDALVVGAFADRVLSAAAGEIDGRTDRALTRAMSASRFTGASEQFVDVVAPAGVKAAGWSPSGLFSRMLRLRLSSREVVSCTP